MSSLELWNFSAVVICSLCAGLQYYKGNIAMLILEVLLAFLNAFMFWRNRFEN